MRAYLPILLMAVVGTACSWSGPDAVTVSGITPARAPDDQDVALRISGSGFEPDVRVDFDRPGASTVDARFQVELHSGADRIVLSDVARLSSTELRATLPAGAPRGTYDVAVRGPRGRVAMLPSAFVVFTDTPPSARLGVSPGSGTAGATVFTLDASGTFDAEDLLSALEFRFDSDGNGNWTAWSSSPTHGHTFASPGVYTAAVQARDSRGQVASATVLVFVAAPGMVVRVTTAADEKDAGATPTSPGGSGLSLREAVAWVNAQGSAMTIRLDAPLTITMVPPQTNMTLTAPGAAVVGEPGVVLDFGGSNQPCITLDGPGERLVGLTLRGCDSTFVSLTTASGGSQVAQLEIATAGHWAYGIYATATSATPTRVGPGNALSGLWIAVSASGANYEIFGNRIQDNSIGVKLYGDRARVWQNLFIGQVSSGPQEGFAVELLNGPGPVEVLQNVFAGNEGGGLKSAAVSSLTVRDNLFTGNGGYGMSAQAAGLAHDHNGYLENASGTVSSGLVVGPTDLLLDPLFIDGPGGDYRLLPQSPAIDAGIDTGIDVNGPAPGHFNGLAPDLGAVEMR